MNNRKVISEIPDTLRINVIKGELSTLMLLIASTDDEMQTIIAVDPQDIEGFQE